MDNNKYINLTQQTVTLRKYCGGFEIMVVPVEVRPCGVVATLKLNKDTAINEELAGPPLMNDRPSYSVPGLPDPIPGTYLIVTRQVFDQVHGRPDVITQEGEGFLRAV